MRVGVMEGPTSRRGPGIVRLFPRPSERNNDRAKRHRTDFGKDLVNFIA